MSSEQEVADVEGLSCTTKGFSIEAIVFTHSRIKSKKTIWFVLLGSSSHRISIHLLITTTSTTIHTQLRFRALTWPLYWRVKGAPAWLNSIQIAQMVGTVVKCRVSGMWALLWALSNSACISNCWIGLGFPSSSHRVSNDESWRLSFQV